MKLKLALITAAIFALSACATKPDPVPAPKPVAKLVKPPVVVEPAPAKPVEEEVLEDLTPVGPPAPQAGSIAHFKYMAGDDRVYFGYNRYDLNPQTIEVLRGQAKWLNEYGSAIVVIGGNADERGTREYNLALGARRADSVKAFLVSQGVKASRITTVSFGKERPIDGGSNEAAWALNRNAHSAVLVGGNS